MIGRIYRAANAVVLVLVAAGAAAIAFAASWLLRGCNNGGGLGPGLGGGSGPGLGNSAVVSTKPANTAGSAEPAKSGSGGGSSNSGSSSGSSNSGSSGKSDKLAAIAAPAGVVETADAVQVNIRLVDSGLQFEGKPLSHTGLTELVRRLHNDRPTGKPIQIIAHEDREARWAALASAEAAVNDLQNLPGRPVRLLVPSAGKSQH